MELNSIRVQTVGDKIRVEIRLVDHPTFVVCMTPETAIQLSVALEGCYVETLDEEDLVAEYVSNN